MTPAYAWPLLTQATGTRTWIKHENVTPTGAFKVRGGLNYVARLLAEGRQVRGLISATRGNHGQSLAFAGRAHDIPVTIVVPEGNSPDKNKAMVGWGATLVERGRDFQEAREHAMDLADKRDLEMVPSFHRDLVAGVATYAAELHQQAPDLDVIYVPVGQGSGLCANIAVRDLLERNSEIVAVGADGAPAHALSFAAGRPVSTEEVDTFVDGVATRVPDADAVEIMLKGTSRFILVDDDATERAMRLLWQTTHHMPEPSGAIALAGLLADKDRPAGAVAAVIMTGGNCDRHLIERVVSRE